MYSPALLRISIEQMSDKLKTPEAHLKTSLENVLVNDNFLY